MNLSFAGCGFLGIYHLGVIKMLISHGQRFLMNVQRYGGASAGALVASILAVRQCSLEDVEESAKFVHELAEDLRRQTFGVLTPGSDLLEPLEVFLHRYIPDDGHVTATNRLFISVTNAVTKKNEIISTYNSKRELIEYLLASSYIPVLTGSKPVFVNGKRYYDGGMTDNLPVFSDGRTISVSPFDGGQEICPSSGQVDTRDRLHMIISNQSYRVNLQNIVRCIHAFVPPSDVVLDAYHNQGMCDAKKFLVTEGYFDP